eukprot:5125103-Pyramimonas_sp.AAC.1
MALLVGHADLLRIYLLASACRSYTRSAPRLCLCGGSTRQAAPSRWATASLWQTAPPAGSRTTARAGSTTACSA